MNMTRRLTIVLVVLFGLLALASSGPSPEDDTNSVAIEEELARAFQVANDVTDVAGYRQSRNQEQETSVSFKFIFSIV
jgi:geranylgeranyl pyrophosphate synthase